MDESSGFVLAKTRDPTDKNKATAVVFFRISIDSDGVETEHRGNRTLSRQHAACRCRPIGTSFDGEARCNKLLRVGDTTHLLLT